MSSEKLAKKIEKKEKGLQLMDFVTWLQIGQEVRNICISIVTLKVNSFQSLFPSFCSTHDGSSLSLKDLPPDTVISLLRSQLEAFPEQRLKVALNRAEMVLLVLNCLLSLGADLKNKLVLREMQVFPERQMERRTVFKRKRVYLWWCCSQFRENKQHLWVFK